MPQDTEKTLVVFRTFKKGGDVIALFPEIPGDSKGNVSSYMHIGQHGAASYHGVIADTRPSTPEEIEPLKTELESEPYGYSLELRKRIPFHILVNTYREGRSCS